jgi:hypothetical protein
MQREEALNMYPIVAAQNYLDFTILVRIGIVADDCAMSAK